MKDKKISIAFTHNALDCRGGAERKLLLIAQNLRANTHIHLRIFVNSFDPQKTFTEYLEGLDVVEVKAKGWIGKFFSFLKIAHMTRGADLIHAHNHPSHFAAVFSKWAKRKPVAWFDNEPLLYLEGTRKRHGGLRLLPIKLFEKIILPSIDTIVANSKNTQNNIKRFLKRESIVIYSGVDTQLLRPAEEKQKKQKKQICAISRFTKEKNLDFVLRLAKEFPDIRFVLAGRGDREEHLRDLSKELQLSNLELRIDIAEEEKTKLYQESDLFMFPTLNEPLGITIVEAMACGVPVVAFRSGGAQETVVHGETGYLAETEEEFKEYIKKLLSDETLRVQFSFASRKRAQDMFSLEQMIAGTKETYRLLLRKYGKSDLADFI